MDDGLMVGLFVRWELQAVGKLIIMCAVQEVDDRMSERK